MTNPSEDIISVFAIFQPDNHYAYPLSEISEDFKFPYDLEYLIEKYKSADCSAVNMVDVSGEDEIRDMFFEFGYYEVYKGVFIISGTKEAIDQIDFSNVEQDWQSDGVGMFPANNYGEYLQKIEGLASSIFINLEDGKMEIFNGDGKIKGDDSGYIKIIADSILKSKKSARLISKLRNNDPNHPVLKEIQDKTGSDVLQTLGDLGDLGF